MKVKLNDSPVHALHHEDLHSVLTGNTYVQRPISVVGAVENKYLPLLSMANSFKAESDILSTPPGRPDICSFGGVSSTWGGGGAW